MSRASRVTLAAGTLVLATCGAIALVQRDDLNAREARAATTPLVTTAASDIPPEGVPVFLESTPELRAVEKKWGKARYLVAAVRGADVVVPLAAAGVRVEAPHGTLVSAQPPWGMTGAGAVAISGDTVVLARDGIAHSERVVVLPYWDRLHTYDWMLGPMLHERVRFVILAGVNLGALACLAALALWWRERRALMLASALTLLSACGPTAKPPPSEPMQTKPAQADEPLVGHVARSEVEKLPKWIDAKKQDDPDPAAAKALASVPAGAKVRVFFGTWCGDSRREVTRFWKALDLAGKVPFEVEYVAVDHAKHAPGDLEAGAGLRYVPTFIVVRDGKEIGRIIESSPNGIEVDLGKLLRGERGGVISLRTDVGAT